MSEDKEREENEDKGSTEIINYENQGVCSFPYTSKQSYPQGTDQAFKSTMGDNFPMSF
jgi:hypothetical protein